MFDQWGKTTMDDAFSLWGEVRPHIVDLEGMPHPGEWSCRPLGEYCLFFAEVEGMEVSLYAGPHDRSWCIRVDNQTVRGSFDDPGDALRRMKAILVDILQNKRRGLTKALQALGVENGLEGRPGDPGVS